MAAPLGHLLADVEYGRAGNHSLRMDAWRPSGEGPFPAVVLVHGGGWIKGHRRASLEPLFAPLEQAGFAWFTISYRFATEPALFGAAIDDVSASLAHIRSHAAKYRVDVSRLALLGESAGAHLAAMAAVRDPNLCGLVCISMPSDLITLAENSPWLPAHLRSEFEDPAWLEMLHSGLRALSPVHNVREGMPPFLLVHGTADNIVPYSQSVEFSRRVREVGGSCELFPIPNAGHGIRWWEGNQRWTAYKSHVTGWLGRHLVCGRKAA